MKRTTIGLTVLLAILICFVGVAQAGAQVEREPVGAARPQGVAQDRLIGMFLDHATAELDLTVEERAGLEEVLRETMERRAELARRQGQLRRAIRDALSKPETADDEFLRLAAEIRAVKREEVELLEWQEERLLTVLNPRKTLRFMLIQQQLAQRIEEMRRRRNR